MASSVSSERAFSQGGITISKRRSHLKGDIVEALQCVKCGIRNGLLFREAAPSSVLEAELEGGEEGEDEADQSADGWDGLLIEEDDDEPMSEPMSD
jgi:hAT family C-terminal dimerisation region